MTRLIDALRLLGLTADVELGGKWVTLRGDHANVYVVAGAWSGKFYTWCDSPEARAIECYPDPVSAIEAGLRRARGRPARTGDAASWSPVRFTPRSPAFTGMSPSSHHTW